MKKLLALVLCVMLFVSVIPTSAFADLPEKIDLKNAVDQMNHLYHAYGAFAVKSDIANTYKGFQSLAELFPKDSKARANAMKAPKAEGATGVDDTFKGIWNRVPNVLFDNGLVTVANGVGYSPEGIFKLIGIPITVWYDHVRAGVKEDTIAKYVETEAKINENIAAESAKLEASMAAVVASTLAQMPAVGGIG